MKLLDYFTNPSVSTRNDQLPFVIAEAGVNHEADMNLAKRLIEEASDAGANAIKFQSYKASTIASKKSALLKSGHNLGLKYNSA